MRGLLYCIGLLVLVGLIVGYLVAHRPSIKNNEANGPTNVHRFTGYKASLKTPVNQGTPLYGEAVTGWATGIYHTDQGA